MLQRHESALGSWEMAHAAPHPALRGHVLRYCGYREDTAGPLARREAAAPAVTVVFSFGPALTVGGERHTSFVVGFGDAYGDTEHAGHQHGMEVKLSPLAVGPLLGVPAPELACRAVPLGAVLGRPGDELAERLADAPSWADRFALLDSALARRLTRPVPSDIVHAWRRLHGGVPVAALARELGWSRRHFGERFRKHVGLAPKPAARVLRFRRALALIERDDGRRLGEIAQACGYYDQAHLNRDFRALAGSSPTDHLARRLPDGGGVVSPGP